MWTRLLTLHMGHTVAAVSTVLAAFLGGLGLGSLAGGEVAARQSRQRAFRLFASLELAVALCALAIPALLAAIQPILASTYGEHGSAAFGIARIISSVVLVGVPATLMGATLPLAIRIAADGSDAQDRHVASLTATNTTGAALGATLAGFVLVPTLGLRYTTLVACAISVASAGIAWLVAARVEETTEPPVPKPEHHPAAKVDLSPDRGRPAVAAIALAITGFTTTANEVAWTRTLALIVGPTTYAFAAMLAVFIVGLAVGSAVAIVLVRHIRRPGLALPVALASIAAVSAWSMARVDTAAFAVAETVAIPDVDFGRMVRLQALTAAVVLLPLAGALGAAFTSALALAAREAADRAVSKVGRLYAINTVGAIAGSATAGFVLIPSVGLQRTIVLSAFLAVAGALVTLVASQSTRRGAIVVLAACAASAIALWLVRPWDMEFLSGGSYKYGRFVDSEDLLSTTRAGTLLYYGEGSASTVSVRRAAGVTSLSIDGKIDASTGGDMLTQKLLAHVPLLLHRAPRRVAIVGLGSGVTLGSALTHPIERADVIEISPEVVRASRQFETANRRALSDPRTRLIVGDGRTHFRFSRDQYDVVISEPSNPWIAGIAALFTREFFESVRRRLAPEGIFCQWAHTYDMRDEDLRSIAATFGAVFPESSMWLVGDSDLLFVGSPGGIVARLPQMSAVTTRSGVIDDLRSVAITDLGNILSTYVGGPAELRSFAEGAPVQTDDGMALEFSAPRGLFERDTSAIPHTVKALATEDTLPPMIRTDRAGRTPRGWASIGAMLLQAEAYEAAYDALSKSAAHGIPDNAIDDFVRAAAGAGRIADAEGVMAAAVSQDVGNVPAHIALSRLRAAGGNVEDAVAAVEPLMRDLPEDPRAFEQAAAVLADTGDVTRLRDVARYQLASWPTRAATAYSAAVMAMLEGRLADAHRLATEGVARNRHDARLLNILGAAAAGLRRRDEAQRAFEAALEQNPRDPVVYVNLGLLHLESGQPDAAARRLGEALLLDPGSNAAREGLRRAKDVTTHRR